MRPDLPWLQELETGLGTYIIEGKTCLGLFSDLFSVDLKLDLTFKNFRFDFTLHLTRLET